MEEHKDVRDLGSILIEEITRVTVSYLDEPEDIVLRNYTIPCGLSQHEDVIMEVFMGGIENLDLNYLVIEESMGGERNKPSECFCLPLETYHIRLSSTALAFK